MKPCFAIEAVPQQKKEKRLQFVSVYWNNSFSKLGFLKKKRKIGLYPSMIMKTCPGKAII